MKFPPLATTPAWFAKDVDDNPKNRLLTGSRQLVRTFLQKTRGSHRLVEAACSAMLFDQDAHDDLI